MGQRARPIDCLQVLSHRFGDASKPPELRFVAIVGGILQDDARQFFLLIGSEFSLFSRLLRTKRVVLPPAIPLARRRLCHLEMLRDPVSCLSLRKISPRFPAARFKLLRRQGSVRM